MDFLARIWLVCLGWWKRGFVHLWRHSAREPEKLEPEPVVFYARDLNLT